MCLCVLVFPQNRSSSAGHEQEREELNDIQVRLPPMSRSRSSLNALGSGTAVNNRGSHNTLTVTTAIVTMSTPSTTSETESVQTQSTSGTLSPATQSQSGVVRISTL